MENLDEMRNFPDDVRCPVEFTRDKIAGKWKLVILWHIYDREIIRYGELKTSVHGITHKMLSSQLKELVEDGIVHKEMYHQVPPKTEYSLTNKGKSIVPILDFMYSWGKEHMKDDKPKKDEVSNK